MFGTFYPGNYVDSAYEIPYEKLYERGYRGIIFDVDNTLVPHGAPADARAIELFERLRAIGFSTCILSCLLYTSPSPRDAHESRMPSSA